MSTSRPAARAMTASERAAFSALLADMSSAGGALVRDVLVLLVAWAVLTILAIGLGIAGLAGLRAVSADAWDWRSPAGALAGAAIALVVAAALLPWWWRARRATHDRQAACRADLAAGRVYDERHRFTDAIAYQEPEHDGVLYLLRSVDDRAYVVYDEASVDGGAGRPGRTDRLRPAPGLHVVRGERSGVPVVRRFEGAPFALAAPRPFGAAITDFPEDDGYIEEGRWDEVIARVAGRSTGSGKRRGG